MERNLRLGVSAGSSHEGVGWTFPPGSELFQLIRQIFDLSLFRNVQLECSLILAQRSAPLQFIISHKLLKLHRHLCSLGESTTYYSIYLELNNSCSFTGFYFTSCCFSSNSDLLRARASMRFLNSCCLRASCWFTLSNSNCFFRIRVFCKVFTPASRTLLEV